MSGSLQQMRDCAKKCAETIQKISEVKVVSHIDADGITSAAIICKALDRAGIDNSVNFVKQLDENAISRLKDQNPELVIFTDLGSGMLESIITSGLHVVISDHHRPRGDPENLVKNHLNPHLFGANGSTDISGSGTTYLLASELGDNHDLADLAIVGAIGDMQNRRNGHLINLNREILEEGVSKKVLSFEKDVMLFGKQTRPIFKLLQYASDPYLPGLTGDEDACIDFLHRIGLRFGDDDRWRRWIDLEQGEKQRIVSALLQHGLSSGQESCKLERLIGEVYILLNEREGTEMRDATEYSTLLNATGRYDNAEIGMEVCMGDREEAYQKASRLLTEHRSNLVNGLKFVKTNGITKLSNLQYFDAGSNIKETIIGIVAGMSTSVVADRNYPIIAFADAEEGVKVSARGTQDLVRKGLNLSEALAFVSAEVGGAGGGHDIAAGATIPQSTKDEFIRKLDSIIGTQILKK
ncbi:single-stranded DNA-specific exonuclease [Methanomethylovorans hollandica DSM 15978]|uniref:Single-stranded DNA-specific exonuclease n=1 Tax=Methanomethylovorans hollandica (strain DSM 15978 / NBRC 107637 / DMS1) TaxID=867904 RepID=L0L1S4_METHD|nr:DHH family phosphoesterase [Methanomethylovorans hollandica]AGB50234.1 single-stranded DNA-specific exonuclease [Methanomethylovorans hollandica DSM 15978]